jgi:hypothetical protein
MKRPDPRLKPVIEVLSSIALRGASKTPGQVAVELLAIADKHAPVSHYWDREVAESYLDPTDALEDRAPFETVELECYQSLDSIFCFSDEDGMVYEHASLEEAQAKIAELKAR